jgi:hypothetical protein
MAAVQNYAGTVDLYTVRLTTVNANRDGTGTIVDVFTVGSGNSVNGVNVFRITAKAQNALSSGTTSQVVVYLWNPGTSQYDCRTEFSLTQSGSPGSTTPTGEGSILFSLPTYGVPGLGVENAWKLALSATVMPTSGAIVCTVECADY